MRRIIWIAFGMALVILRGIPLVTTAIANWSGIQLLQMPACDPQALACSPEPALYPPLEWAGNQASLSTVREILVQTGTFSPDNTSIRNRLAEVDFALGERTEAAVQLPHLTATAPQMQIGGIRPAYATRLIMPDRFEYYLMAAHQSASQGHWLETVNAYRWAFSLAPDYVSQTDSIDYFIAIANLESQRAADNSQFAHHAYLAGKYFARAGDWDQANDWLTQAMAAGDWNALTPEEQARTWLLLGLVREQTADLVAAASAYEHAATVDPTLNEPRLRLLRVAGPQSMPEIISALATRGPADKLTNSGSDADGWTLVGYDLDREQLQTGGPLEIWLWWRLPTESQPPSEGGVTIAPYWVEQQIVINLAPNPGFEWGNQTADIPFGYLNIFETDKNGSAVVLNQMDNTRNPSKVLRLISGGNAGRVGVKSVPISIDSNGWYLLAGEVQSNGGTSMGRECFQIGNVDYSVAQSRMGNPPADPDIQTLSLDLGSIDHWTQVAGLLQPWGGSSTIRCHLYLEQDKGTAILDQVLLARLKTP